MGLKSVGPSSVNSVSSCPLVPGLDLSMQVHSVDCLQPWLQPVLQTPCLQMTSERLKPNPVEFLLMGWEDAACRVDSREARNV
jgi:hypothetical protein